MLAKRRARKNRPRRKPPLALALFGLLATTSALMVTSSAGQAAITASVPAIKRCADDIETVCVESVARERGSKALSENVPADR